MNETMKKKVRLNVISSISILITIAIILFEIFTKRPRFISLIALGVTFIIMGVTQIFNYKLGKRISSLIVAIIYFVAGIANIALPFIK